MPFLLITLLAAMLSANPVAAQDTTTADQSELCNINDTVEPVLTLMAERLKLAPDVARYKWNRQGKIEDLTREQAIIVASAQQAFKQGLPVDWAERFFRAQIEASKRVQRTLFAHWRQTQAGHFNNVPDLATTIRPKLDALTTPLIKALADAWPQLGNPACISDVEKLVGQNLKSPEFDTVTTKIAAEPLLTAK